MPLLSMRKIRIQHSGQKHLHLPRCTDTSASPRKYLTLFKSHSNHTYFKISALFRLVSASVIRSSAFYNHIVSIFFFSIHFSSLIHFFVLSFTSRKGENRIGKKLSKGKPLQLQRSWYVATVIYWHGQCLINI